MKTLLGAQGELHTHGNRSVRVTVIKWIWKYRGLVCQAEAWREPTARPLLLTLLLPPSSLLWSPYLSTSLLKLALQILSPPPPSSKTHILTYVHFLFLPSLFLSDYGVDRSRVWEQRAYQLWWGSQLPEVPPHFLRPEPFIPPHWRGLGLSLQSRPEGETVLDVTFLFLSFSDFLSYL